MIVQKNCKMSFTPSLKSLRSFEAAARLESLTLAAGELNVSVSAIAFQVRQVETALGRKLLRREGRGLSATAEGKALARDLGAAFGQVAAAVARCRAEGAVAVTVSMLPSFAALWLLPRLADFRKAHPDVEVRILTSSRRVDLAAEPVDCAIRCGAGRWDGVDACLLFEQRLAPLCSPGHAAARRKGGLATAVEAELIVNARHEGEWADWRAAQGEMPHNPHAAQRFDGRELVAEAVLAGLGIGLMDVSVHAAQIAQGRLVQLGPAVPTGWGHYFLWPRRAEPGAPVSAFRDWLFETAGAEIGPRSVEGSSAVPPPARTVRG